jgi:hypothetical protein
MQPPLLLRRARHRRLADMLHSLQQDPSQAAERKQEALTEMLRPRLPRQAKWVVAEAALIAVLAWPLAMLLVDAAGGFVCAP